MRAYLCHPNITGDIARGRPSSRVRSKLNLGEIMAAAAGIWRNSRASKRDVRFSGFQWARELRQIPAIFFPIFNFNLGWERARETRSVTSDLQRNVECRGRGVSGVGLKFWSCQNVDSIPGLAGRAACVSLSKTLNHNCFVLRMARKAAGPVCCVLCNACKRTQDTCREREGA